MNILDPTTRPETRRFSIASIVAVIAAILSFTNGAVLGALLAVVAILAGLLGIGRALSPRKRGGFASTIAIIMGAFGILAALVKAILWFF